MKKFIYWTSGVLLLILVFGFSGESNYTIINKSGVKIRSISISPSGEDFQNPVLFLRAVDMNESTGIYLDTRSGNGAYDIKFTDEKEKEYTMPNVEFGDTEEIILIPAGGEKSLR